MALSQSFNVQLALLPAGEDPDSYVQAHGRSGFEAYIKAHKRDVIGFRLEVGMKEAGGDPVKKNKLVNEVAESIARINKAEDFTLQQHYIREASRLMSVDEGGLITLVNKYLRERLEGEARARKKEAPDATGLPATPVGDGEAVAPLQGLPTHEKQEWALIRLLIEHGASLFEAETTVADLLAQRVEPDLIETPLARQMWDTYFTMRGSFGNESAIPYFVAHPDPLVQQRTALLLHTRDEVSHNWKEMYGIDALHGDNPYIRDAESTLAYFELKKLKVMQAELAKRFKDEKDEERLQKMTILFLQLKKDEQEILKRSGTVIVKTEA